MGQHHDFRFPGEDGAYREARDALLAEEQALRRRIEDVAAQRRALPPGGALKEDYRFQSADGAVGFSELFAAGRDTLALYNFMFTAEDETPCPMCTAFLDSLDGNAPHLAQRISLAVVAKAPVERLHEWAETRGWRNLRLLSCGGTDYNRAYGGEGPDGVQHPMMNVFRRGGGAIRHSYATELYLAPAEAGQNPRHVDQMWPLWSLLDLTPEGRGESFYPSVAYD